MSPPPFLSNTKEPRIVILGGGCAGLAALATLRNRSPSADITLIDARPAHLKITHLHESFRRPFSTLWVPYQRLAERFGCRFIQHEAVIEDGSPAQWQAEGSLEVAGSPLPFDYLLLATGTAFKTLPNAARCLTLADFARTSGPDLLAPLLDQQGSGGFITVAGGGPTGLQFLFEIDHYLKARKSPWRLRLIDAEMRLLQQFNPALGRYVEERLVTAGIDYLPCHYFREQGQATVFIEGRDGGLSSELPSALSLLFLGGGPPSRWDTNAFGQVLANGRTLDRIFAAGDRSWYHAPGSNTLTNQSAVRKGRLAARNILRHAGNSGLLAPYLHRNMGYVINLGPTDAVGWVGFSGNLMSGLPATALKEAVETQYDLLLAGIDTYLV